MSIESRSGAVRKVRALKKIYTKIKELQSDKKYKEKMEQIRALQTDPVVVDHDDQIKTYYKEAAALKNEIAEWVAENPDDKTTEPGKKNEREKNVYFLRHQKTEQVRVVETFHRGVKRTKILKELLGILNGNLLKKYKKIEAKHTDEHNNLALEIEKIQKPK